VVGQRQQRCPTGGQEESGTADDGTTLAVWVPPFAEDDFDALFSFRR
jgi:hypothetical protein